MGRLVVAAVLLALLWLACGREEAPPAQSPAPLRYGKQDQQVVDAATKSLADAPTEVRHEVMRLCDKWASRDGECSPAVVHLDQARCWLSDGAPALERAHQQRIRKRPTIQMALRYQRLCMEARRWKLISRAPHL